MKRPLLLVCLLPLAAAAPALADAPSAPSASSAPIESGPVLSALRDELARAKDSLVMPGMSKPYYVDFDAADVDSGYASATFGATVTKVSDKSRRLQPHVRVGDYAADSGNFENEFAWRTSASHRRTAVDPSYDGVRHDAWLGVDAAYKTALDAFGKKTALRSNEQAPASADRTDDFSREKAAVKTDATPPAAVDLERLAALARDVSAIGRDAKSVSVASALASATSWRRYFVSSEGASVVAPGYGAELTFLLRAQADDGMVVSTFVDAASCKNDGLPARDALVAEAKRAAAELEEIRKAPVIDDYSGPVLFEGVAAAQLVEHVLGRALGGTPPALTTSEKAERSDVALAGQLGQRVMPAGFRLEDDPTVDHLGALPLAGCYAFDDEGVPAQKVSLVEDGVLKTLLMSRTPRKGIAHSNGHARSDYGGDARASIGNLVLTTAKPLGAKELRARAVAEAKAQKKPYALIVRLLDDRHADYLDASRTDMFNRNVRGMKALVVVKLTLDGKEERVRGGVVDYVQVRTLKDILAAGGAPSVIGHVSGSGYSVVAPSLLFKDLDVKKPHDPPKQTPLLPRP